MFFQTTQVMDTEIFIPSKRDVAEIQDPSMMNQIISLYLDRQFKEMKGFILEYGEENFFSDLVIHFKYGYWRNPTNRYYVFAGITVAFFKIY
jgi:hypothetical protein